MSKSHMERFICSFLVYAAVFPSIWGQTVLYSQFSGAWNAQGIWNTAPDGTGDVVHDPNQSSYDLMVQTGHTLTLPSTRRIGSLEVASGASVAAGVSALRYLEIYGEHVRIDGVAGGVNDGLSFDVNGPLCVLSGQGTISLQRLRKDNDPGSAPVTSLSIHTDVTLRYNADGRTALCNTAIGKVLDATIEVGRTVLVTQGNVSLDGNDGTNSVNHGGSLTVYGHLNLAGSSGHLYVRTDNSASFPVQYTIEVGGQITVGGTIYGNHVGGPATAGLTVSGGGILTVKGIVSGWNEQRNESDFAMGSLVVWESSQQQELESMWHYGDLWITGGNKVLNGDTWVNGQLAAQGSGLVLGGFDLFIALGGTLQGFGEGNFIRTTESGSLYQHSDAYEVWYPVGKTTYNPIWLTNDGAPDMIGVRVDNEVLEEGYAGPPLHSGAVNRCWAISEVYPGGSVLDARVQWRQVQELAGFQRGASKVAAYTGAYWDVGPAFPAQGNNPHTAMREGISEPQLLSVVSGAVLPVELIAFKLLLKRPHIVLHWQTASEAQNAGFHVERSVDGSVFARIAFVKGMGIPWAYHYTDEHVPPGVLYYRLCQEDTDGQLSYGPVRSIQVRAEQGLDLYPVPAKDWLTVRSPDIRVAEAHWVVLDAGGRLLLRGHPSAPEFRVPVSELPRGVYTLVLYQGVSAWVERFERW
jgi:hypothetical protein